MAEHDRTSMNDFGTLAAVVYQAGFHIDEFLAAIARRQVASDPRVKAVYLGEEAQG